MTISVKEGPVLVSAGKVKRVCKCWVKKPKVPTFKLHTKEVFSDGWTKFVCSDCGQVKFALGERVEPEDG
ncbi:hypothetical protein ES705_45180 [subsurface metagenome]